MLYNVMFIGIPSFILAMEANKKIVRGKFLVNVFRNALPAGLTSFLSMIAVFYFATQREIYSYEISTMSLIVVAFVSALLLYNLCRPLNTLRIALIITMLTGFIVGFIILTNLDAFETFVALTSTGIWITIITCLCAIPAYLGLHLLFHKKSAKKR